ncbi:S1C family serine protease [Muricomes intestini]|jgi:serine protease Do|uniref:Serine protease Do n=1 Tax=Muricomes intestini TaxID=1796634 RepID=A0A4R3K4N9_9FIRM|nr:S1C family serine protease [Muricomes intestini]TCS77716.1 serine protease Do [Muricomes intestini]HAX53290.1 trypsin [Lachnospiraceae bacterium]HCR83701.1 trypsin [Lachnospiraceae bacterium]
MPYDEKPKQGPDTGPQEEKEEKFSFIQETIKPKPVTRRKILTQLARIVIYGLIFGAFACLGFFALKPWVQNRFQNIPKTVTIQEDEDEGTVQTAPPDTAEAVSPVLNADSYKEIMRSMYDIAKDAGKCVVTVQPADKEKSFSSEGSGTENSVAGLVAADNGKELLILCDNSVCADAENWTVTFSDGSQYGATLKKQDKNSGFAALSVQRINLTTSTWNSVLVATLGNSSVTTEGDVVIALGNMFGYAKGTGFGIVSSNIYEESKADGQYNVLTTDIPAENGGTGILFNLKGEVIGMISPGIWENTEANTTKALAISDLKSTIELLVNGESVPYVGIYGTTINDTMAEKENMPVGIYVIEVNPDSPAMAAGIQSGDILQEVSEAKVSSTLSYEKAVMSSKVGGTIKMKGKRRGANGYVDIDFNVTIGSLE